MRSAGQRATGKRISGIFVVLALALLGAAALKTGGREAKAAEIEEFTGRQDSGTAQGVDAGIPQAGATDKRDEIIKDLLRRVEILENRLRSLGGEPEPAMPPAEAVSPAPPAKDEEEERIAQAALERTLIERSGILLPAGTLEIEPSLTYAHASADKISIDGISIESTLVIGEIISDRVRRNILLPALTFRVGLPNAYQLETKFPLRYESDRTVRGDSTEQSRDIFGLGDIELGLSHQLLWEKGWIPDLLGSLRWKTNTGHNPPRLATDELPLGAGYHALQFMLTSLKIKEPAAFFGSLFYTANYPVSKEEGRFHPGNTWGLNLGFALALNLDTSINFVWEQRFTDRAELNNSRIIGSSLYPGNLRIGATYSLTPAISLDASVVIGLTRDAPDVQAIVALPIRYPGFFSDAEP